jgi:Ca-activated chloride channel family protein
VTAIAFRSPWLGVVAVVAALAVAASLWWRWRHTRDASWRHALPIANVDHAEASPVFLRLRRRYGTLVGAEVAVLSVVGIAAALLAMRPLSEQDRERAALNRDVMLCLDVSGSMKELDESILRQFVDIAAGLPGDRIGLTIWNGSAITVFPLTDDTDYVAATLEWSVDQLNRGARSFVLGTEEGGSSLIGDGLASCVLRFDRLAEQRARSIVFATDNALAGDPIVSLQRAAVMARSRDIRVYSVAPANYITPSDAAELESAVSFTGGAYLTTDDEKVVDHVIAAIVEQEATHLEQPPETVRDDRPTRWAAMALAGVGVLGVVSWRLRR